MASQQDTHRLPAQGGTAGERADDAAHPPAMTLRQQQRALGEVFAHSALDDARRFADAADTAEVSGDGVIAAMWRELADRAVADAKRAARRIGGTR